MAKSNRMTPLTLPAPKVPTFGRAKAPKKKGNVVGGDLKAPRVPSAGRATQSKAGPGKGKRKK